MSAVTRQLWKGATSFFGGYSPTSTSVIGSNSSSIMHLHHQLQWCRGIRVRVWNDNLEQALVVMGRKMVSSGIERLIKRQPTRHIKNSEKRVLARKNLEHRIRSQDLARKLRSILIKKFRGFIVCRTHGCRGRSVLAALKTSSMLAALKTAFWTSVLRN